MTVRPGGRPGPHTAATNIQSGWRGYHTRNNDNQVSTSIQYLLVVDEVPDSKVDFSLSLRQLFGDYNRFLLSH